MSRSRLDLVNRYVAEAQGPPPRSPLRFWIGGEWVEMSSSPEPEPLLEEGASGGVADGAADTALSRARADTGSPSAPRQSAAEQAESMRPLARDDAAQVAAKLRHFGYRDDRDLVRAKIATLREQRDAGELSYNDFATRVAELLSRTVTPHVKPDDNPSST